MPKIHLGERNDLLRVTVPSVDRFTFNRALGLGICKAATEHLVDGLIAWYKNSGACRFMGTLCPLAAPTHVER